MTLSSTPVRSPLFQVRAVAAGLTLAFLMTADLAAHAQTTAPDTTAQPAAVPAQQTPATPVQSITLSNQPKSKTRKQKEEKVVSSKDTVKEDKRLKKDNPLAGLDVKYPDKALYDKAMDATKHGRFDVARLELQTLLNTYPDSQFQMRAKLAIADSWFKEGGTAALTQAEQEYGDFITFFPNAPEAAEAQMRIGDIYFREMDKPDRDNSKALHAQEAYRLMLQQFPDSPRVKEAAQRLREVQESLAGAEADVASFYATHQNWAATIARYQTVADTYPLYSHIDDVLVGLGDAYEAQAKFYRESKLPLPEAARARLEKLYDDQAAAAYRKVVLEHSAAPHVEDARDRLAAMNLPIPTPTPEQVAASQALENSRGRYTLSNRAVVLFLHRPDTVPAATAGDPPLVDAKPTLAPTIVRKGNNDFYAAVSPAANVPPTNPAAVTTPTDPNATPAPVVPVVPAAPLAFQDVPAAGGGAPVSAVSAVQPSSTGPSSGGVGIEIVQPSSRGVATPVPAVGSAPPAFPGTTGTAAPSAKVSESNGGLEPVGPPVTTVLAPIEHGAPAPDAVNDIKPGTQPAAQTAPANGKKAKPDFDKKDESSSKHKKKKGLAKLNPL